MCGTLMFMSVHVGGRAAAVPGATAGTARVMAPTRAMDSLRESRARMGPKLEQVSGCREGAGEPL